MRIPTENVLRPGPISVDDRREPPGANRVLTRRREAYAGRVRHRPGSEPR